MNDILEPIQQTPGQILKTAREEGQISISEVAQRLLLSKKVIAAIEEDDYSKIPAQVYAEGYLKAYAQFLKIPASTVLESFRRLNVYNVYSDPKEKVEIKPQEQTKQIQPTNKYNLQKFANLLKEEYRIHLIAGIFAFLILSIVIFFVGKHFWGKDAEIINVPNISDSAVNKNEETVSDSQMPIVTTSSTESATTPEANQKQKSVSKKTGKQETKNVSLMLDSTSSEIKLDNDNEPKLILTPPRDPVNP